ncbi:hypothetical protein OIK40_03110 [Erythrobacter sp. sf7]|uniref:Uncharacterized protein n=1 Tax=Erythrobacter fulvus TaxID=2987523 RepID=A0ABT5JN46_9SPHN|nr:hypothetical protein [Erythrobacter fulvus]MDC8753625.1 hypothetical protein [Erythrobacter fulvus]
MTRGQKDKPGKRKHARKQRRPLATHPLFAPVLGLWGAALGGLVVLVLPPATAFAAAVAIGLGVLGGMAQFVLAALAATVLGTALFVMGRKAGRNSPRPASDPSLAMMALRRVQTIDPASELGSASLDEPIETMPFAAREPEAEAAAPQVTPPPPRMLDLSEFAELPGRNAVWVEETDVAPAAVSEPDHVPDPLPESAPVAAAVAASPANPGVIAQLRAVPPSELSLVQMVERFAAALHERQAGPGPSGHRADPAAREAVLAEALRALAALSDADDSGAGSEPLRDALTRLQELRGAA